MSALDGAAELRDLATVVAAEAAAFVREHVDEVRAVESKSSVSDVVTEIDRQTELLIIERLLAKRPDDGILAEEGGSRTGSSGLTWVIDPLDGTANYTHKMPPFAVSIAACTSVNGSVIDTLAGVVHDAAHDEIYVAVSGQGAMLNSVQLQRSHFDHLRTAIVGTGFSHTDEVRQSEISCVARVLPLIGDLRRSGSGAVDLCWVAAGRLDAFYQAGLKPWDFAAAQLIVRESGAWFGLRPGMAGSSETVVATAPGLEDQFLDVLATALIEADSTAEVAHVELSR